MAAGAAQMMGEQTEDIDDRGQDGDEDADERPSKSSRKRAAHAAQAMGERLITLRETELERLALPEPLLTAVRDARRIRARGGLARQKQYIGKLMRDIDLAPLEAALGPAIAPPRPRRAKPGRFR
jgi:ribosome-associated protein